MSLFLINWQCNISDLIVLLIFWYFDHQCYIIPTQIWNSLKMRWYILGVFFTMIISMLHVARKSRFKCFHLDVVKSRSRERYAVFYTRRSGGVHIATLSRASWKHNIWPIPDFQRKTGTTKMQVLWLKSCSMHTMKYHLTHLVSIVKKGHSSI